MLAGYTNQTAELWQMDGEQPRRIWSKSVSAPITALAISDRYGVEIAIGLATGAVLYACEIRVQCDFEDGMVQLANQLGPITGIVFNPDAPGALWTSSQDGSIYQWQVSDGQVRMAEAVIRANSPILDFAYDHARSSFSYTQESSLLMDGTTIFSHEGGRFSLFDKRPTNRETVIIEGDRDTQTFAIMVADTASGEVVHNIPFYPDGEASEWACLINGVDYSPDGSLIALGGGDCMNLLGAKSYSVENPLYILDAETLEVLVTYTNHTNRIIDVAFSADGTRIITASQDGTMRIWGLAEDDNEHE